MDLEEVPESIILHSLGTSSAPEPSWVLSVGPQAAPSLPCAGPMKVFQRNRGCSLSSQPASLKEPPEALQLCIRSHYRPPLAGRQTFSLTLPRELEWEEHLSDNSRATPNLWELTPNPLGLSVPSWVMLQLTSSFLKAVPLPLLCMQLLDGAQALLRWVGWFD